MDTYLEILQQKAQKIGANIEHCGFDKECITDTLALKVRSDLENESLEVIKEKALAIDADTSKVSDDKEALLEAIETKIKEILEKENELHTSIELQQNFIPLDIG